MVRKKYDVVVAGAGLGGLVSAAYLAAAGLRPLVLESSGRVGGRIGSINHHGFSIDVCSYVSYKTLLEVMDELQIRFPWCELPPNRGYVQPIDRLFTPFPVLNDVAASAGVLGLPRDVVARYKAVMDRLAAIPRDRARALKKVRIADWVSPDDWTVIRPALEADWQFRPWIVKPEQASELSVGELVSILTSGGPTEQPVPMKKLYPADPDIGGNQAIPEAFAALIRRAGGRILTNSEVIRIGIEKGKVAAVTYRDVNGIIEDVPTDTVFCDIAVWDLFSGILDRRSFPEDMIENARELRKWNISNICIGAGLKALPHRRHDGKVEDFPGWNRLLLGSRSRLYYGGGFIVTSLASPSSAPVGKQLLCAMKWVPEKTISNLGRVRAAVAETVDACRRIYADWDDVCQWVKFFTYRKSSPIHSTTTVERPPMSPGVEGLYLVADTTETGDGRPYCIDLSCYQGRLAARTFLGGRHFGQT